MEEVHDICGTPAILKILLDEGLLDGDCLTVTGKTLRENLEEIPSWNNDLNILSPLNEQLKQTAHLQILYGHIAPAGSVAKLNGNEDDFFKGLARVFHSEAEALDKIKKTKER